MPGADILDCNGHGTHVAGIVGANSPLFSGAAPNATLGIYRVFGCSGTGTNDVVIDGFLRAHESRGMLMHVFYCTNHLLLYIVHLISASLGTASGWSEDAVSVVVSRIIADGLPCIVAAGNDGARGKVSSTCNSSETYREGIIEPLGN